MKVNKKYVRHECHRLWKNKLNCKSLRIYATAIDHAHSVNNWLKSHEKWSCAYKHYIMQNQAKGNNLTRNDLLQKPEKERQIVTKYAI